MSSRDSMLSAALDYAARGLPVFPCSPSVEKGRGKRPLVPAETAPGARDGGLYLATTDEARIRAWWGQWPAALIGMPTGLRAGVVVVDLDPRAFDADDMLAALEAWLGGEPFVGPLVETQSGGLHLWFRYPDDLEKDLKVGNRAGLFVKIDGAPIAIREHVDVRGEGGYVILPPSTMADGKVYRWKSEPDAEPPALPARLADVILKRGEFAPQPMRPAAPVAGRPATPTGSGDLAQEAVRRYALAVLDRARADMAGAGQGTRGSTLNSLAFMLGPYVEAGAVSEREAWAALQDGADASGLTATDGQKPCEDKIRRGLAAGRAGPKVAEVAAKLVEVGRTAQARGGRRPPSPSSEADYGAGAPAAEPTWPAGPQPAPVATTDYDGGEDDDTEGQAPSRDDSEPDPAVVAECASLDHSDTDNATRLIAHWGRDLAVLAQDEATGGTWLAWAGTHWDIASGAAMARLTAQGLGYRIGLEADHLTMTRDEEKAVEAARAAKIGLKALARKPAKDWTEAEQEAAERMRDELAAGDDARAALDRRKKARRSFAVSSKNKARIESMLELAAPRLRRPADSFNADRARIACKTHTLTFGRALDPECPDPDATRYVGTVEATRGHAREHWLTAIVPCAYEPEATAPRWRAFLEQMLPDPAKRRTVQAFTALGLLGVPVQYLMFHYGKGANGKSVFLETVTRILGPGLAVGLPRESIVGGGERGAGAASPDLVRLFGKRFVRVLEVPGDVPLQEDLIKRLTGGESFPVRTLFKGYFEFQSIATPHMSGNGFPTIDGTDLGIWRRLLVVHWDQTIPEDKRRDFEEVVGEFTAEAPGILNWLIEGILDYMAHGLVVAPAVRTATDEYREEMDPVGEFIAACIEAKESARIPAAQAYEAYVSWSMANAKKVRTNTKFGRVMASHFKREAFAGRNFYMDVDLHDVPERPADPRFARDRHAEPPHAWSDDGATDPQPV
jgi:putative DNA primase/helicase